LKVGGDELSHTYVLDDVLTLWVNTIGPYHNPQETYPYYSLPYCKPEHGISTAKKPSGIGEVLEGNHLQNSGFKLHYQRNVNREDVCDIMLDAASAAEFELAVDQQYWYELILDDLPMWGMVGEVLRDEQHGKMEKHIFTHRSLTIEHNGNRIIEANLTSENPVSIEPGRKLEFTYSVHWISTAKPFEKRFDRYLEYDFFEHRIHWFSVFNSFMMVVFLCGLVGLILLRTLRNDFAKYSKDEDIDVEGLQVIGEDTGWKQIHGDVFRAPENLVLFSALLGTGWQLSFLVLGVILYAMAGPYLHGNMYEDRGEMVSTFIVCFALSSVVAGYSSGSFFRRYNQGRNSSQWQHAMIWTMVLFPSILLVVTLGLNVVAGHYEAISAIPIGIILKVSLIWLCVAVPLCMVGTIAGRHISKRYEPPCRVNSIPRPVPSVPWYATSGFIIPASGILPFGSIFIEMYFIFTAFWSYKFYYVYGFMLLVYIILALVTISTTIVAAYFVLNAENYNWQWVSLASAGSSSVYVFMYSVFYFLYKTEMNGFLQVSFYFAYMFLFCLALFFICGSIGVWGADVFVHRIYQHIKID